MNRDSLERVQLLLYRVRSAGFLQKHITNKCQPIDILYSFIGRRSQRTEGFHVDSNETIRDEANPTIRQVGGIIREDVKRKTSCARPEGDFVTCRLRHFDESRGIFCDELEWKHHADLTLVQSFVEFERFVGDIVPSRPALQAQAVYASIFVTLRCPKWEQV